MTLWRTISGLIGLDPSGNGNGLARYLPAPLSLGVHLDPSTRGILEIFDRDTPRQLRYQRYMDYYTADMYTRDSLGRRSQEKVWTAGGDVSAQLNQLYAFTRAFYNIVTKSVDVDVNTVFRTPTIIQAKQDGQQPALDEILKYSKFAERGPLFIRYGAITGDAYLRVYDDWDNDQVKIFAYSPDLVRIKRNAFDKDVVDYAVISYNFWEEDPQRRVNQVRNRTDIIWPDEIKTFLDGQPYGFDGYSDTLPNRLGVVPVRHVANLDLGLDYGLPTFNHVVPTIDVVNEILSFLMNIIRMNADPVILAYGIQEGGLAKGVAGDPNKSVVWYMPNASDGSKVQYLEWKGNLPDVMNVLKEVRADVADQMPEMHIAKMQQSGTYTGFALNSALYEFVLKISQMRTTYSSAINEVASMALAAKAMTSGASETFDPMDPKYEVETVMPQVLPVDEDALLNRVIAKLEAGLYGEEDALRELGVAKEDIPDFLARAQERRDRQLEEQTALAAAKTDQATMNNQGGPADQNRANPADRMSRRATGQPAGKILNARGDRGKDRKPNPQTGN
jgi:hypothetical protein